MRKMYKTIPLLQNGAGVSSNTMEISLHTPVIVSAVTVSLL